MTYAAFDAERTGPVAELILKGPGRGNAFGPDFWREAPAAFQAFDDDDEVRVIIVRGSGKTFSYGLDLMAMSTELAPLLGEPQLARGRTDFLELIRRMQAASLAPFRCKKPVIAAIHGHCIGAGLDLAAACDLRLAAAGASFSLREVRVAMVADMGSLQILPHLIGEGLTRELALTGKDIDAERALAIGLVSEVVDDDQALLLRARTVAQAIADNPPLVVRGIKEVMNARLASEQRQGLEHVAVWNAAFLQSKDLLEAISAFAERRDPSFSGE